MPDPLDLPPYADDWTYDVLAEAYATLAWLRGLDHDPDPAVRLPFSQACASNSTSTSSTP